MDAAATPIATDKEIKQEPDTDKKRPSGRVSNVWAHFTKVEGGNPSDPRTPTSRRNRPNTPQSQEDQEFGFQAFTQQQGYRPHFSQQILPQISQQYPPQWSQQNPPQYFYNSLGHPQQIPYQLTRSGMIEQGCTPTNFNPSSPFNLADDYVPETQPSTPNTPQSISTQQSIPEPSNPRPTKKGNKAAKQAWSREEEVALVSAWVDVSEDPVAGSFWARIGHVFFTRLGREPGYRSTHQLNSKFKDLNKKINWFGGIYNNLANNRSSGMSEADISRTAHERYLAQYKVAFTHEQAWDVLKQYPKWGAVPTMTTTSSRGSKCTQPFDDDEQLQRPIGRNKAKKTSTSNTSGANTNESVTQMFTTLNANIEDHMEYKMKKLDIELKKMEQEQEDKRAQRFDKDFAFYTAPHDHLTGTALDATLARKEQIRKFHDW